MDMLQHLGRLLAYDVWANREALTSLKMIDVPSSRSLKLMSHIIAAEQLWLARLKQDEKAVVVWPDLSLNECEVRIADLSNIWPEYLNNLTAEELYRPISYVNSKGEPWSSAPQDILLHVVMHSNYHRGQIASELRASGHTPAYTDFIHSVRQGLLE